MRSELSRGTMVRSGHASFLCINPYLGIAIYFHIVKKASLKAGRILSKSRAQRTVTTCVTHVAKMLSVNGSARLLTDASYHRSRKSAMATVLNPEINDLYTFIAQLW